MEYKDMDWCRCRINGSYVSMASRVLHMFANIMGTIWTNVIKMRMSTTMKEEVNKLSIITNMVLFIVQGMSIM